MIKAGLILEGGAERGVFTAGVLDCLMERDIWFEYSCGVSAGACSAVDYVSKQIGRTRDALIPGDPSYRMAKISAIPKQHSLIDMEMLFDRFPNDLIPFDYDTYFTSELQCEMVVTSCETGKPEYMDNRTDRDLFMTICRASSSIPLLSPPVTIGGKEYVDGGVSDGVPLLHSMKRGFRKNAVVLTREAGYRKKAPGKVFSEAYRILYRRYPALVRTLHTYYRTYNRTLDLVEKWESEGKIFVLRPEMKPVDRLETDPEKLSSFYRHGYSLTERRLDELMDYLNR